MASSQFKSYKWFKIHSPAEYVAHVEINRSDKLNAFSQPMWEELRVVFTDLSASSDVRAIVLSGSGPRAFTAGLDVVAAATSSTPLSPDAGPSDPARKAAANRQYINEFQDCITAVERCTKPVACVLHGLCYGLAIDISAATDVRFASADARMCVKEVDIGLAADIGTLTRLPKVVGNMSWVKEVCYTAREFGADEALRVGFVSTVESGKEQTVQKAIEWAIQVSGKSPVAVQGTKELIQFSIDHSIQDGLRYTSVWNGAALQTQDVVAAIKANTSKKKPTFEKL